VKLEKEDDWVINFLREVPKQIEADRAKQDAADTYWKEQANQTKAEILKQQTWDGAPLPYDWPPVLLLALISVAILTLVFRKLIFSTADDAAIGVMATGVKAWRAIRRAGRRTQERVLDRASKP